MMGFMRFFGLRDLMFEYLALRFSLSLIYVVD